MRTPLTAFKRWLWTVRFEKDYMPVFQNVSESPQVPRKDWQWWDLKLSLWKYDTSLTMEAFSPCGTITITVRGPATEILPEKSVFKPKQGEWFSGRQVSGLCSQTTINATSLTPMQKHFLGPRGFFSLLLLLRLLLLFLLVYWSGLLLGYSPTFQTSRD